MKLSASAATRTLRGQRWGERGQRSVALVSVGVLNMSHIVRTRAETDCKRMYMTVRPKRKLSFRPCSRGSPSRTITEEWDAYSARSREVVLVPASNAFTSKKIEFPYRERDLTATGHGSQPATSCAYSFDTDYQQGASFRRIRFR